MFVKNVVILFNFLEIEIKGFFYGILTIEKIAQEGCVPSERNFQMD